MNKFLNLFRKKTVVKTKELVEKRLQELGYFKYVDSNKLDLVIQKTFEDYNDDGVIKFSWEGELNRLFSIDAEFIYEADGIKSQIEGMLEVFKGIGINLTIGKYVEHFDNESATYTKRTIELNGKTYDTSGTSDWGTAFSSGVKLINEILINFEKEERIYGLFMDETSMMIILDKPLFEYLNNLIPKEAEERPIEIGR